MASVEGLAHALRNLDSGGAWMNSEVSNRLKTDWQSPQSEVRGASRGANDMKPTDSEGSLSVSIGWVLDVSLFVICYLPHAER
jgi:hypothetical protein